VPRSLKIKTAEIGIIEALVIRQEGGVWEPEWEPLRTTPAGVLIPVMPREYLEHALRGWSRPLVQALGIAPFGALRKLNLHESRVCHRRKQCASHRSEDCVIDSKDLAWCFEPEGLPPIARELVRLWRESVYVLVTIEESAK
jgi:hypothetical protein